MSELDARLRFILEADALKGVERRNPIANGARMENTAEHSWHLALMALVLAPHANESVDRAHVVAMLLVHDLVEIDAGDTYVYDDSAMIDKAEREMRAADRLFGLLPAEQRDELRALWDEYEAGETPEARFAHAIDRLSPLMLNHATQGETWKQFDLDEARVRSVNAPIGLGADDLWTFAQTLIEAGVAQGWLKPAK
jgi:putative hydrolase of HD superfamily